jgi:outer membrane protein OmpA-like peptidoglycan-associated protein
VALTPHAFTQDEQPEATEEAEPIEPVALHDGGKWALGLGPEWNMDSYRFFAAGAAFALDFNLPHSMAVGLTVDSSFKGTGFTALEPAALFRWYFLGKGHFGFFVQADVGAFLYFEGYGRDEYQGQIKPFVLGGGRVGYRFPLGKMFYIEPYARGGYPFAYGVGVNAGIRFVKTEKKPPKEKEVITEETKEKIAEDIAEDISRLNMDDVSVRVEDEGITISMDIQFRADTAIMLPGEREKLDKIIEILRRYVERKIMVSGHTALAGTAEGRERLSRERAAVVAAYIIEQKACTPDRMIVRGYGAERPLGDNNTDEGRRKNRRVEITLLD